MNTDNFYLCLSVSSVANLFSIRIRIATGSIASAEASSLTDLDLVCEGLRGLDRGDLNFRTQKLCEETL
jgi:hypothetical protein